MRLNWKLSQYRRRSLKGIFGEGMWSIMGGLTFELGISGNSSMLLDILFFSSLVWYDLLLLCPVVYSKLEIFEFSFVIYVFCFYILTIASLYLALYSSIWSSISWCLPIGYSSYCYISTSFLSAVTSFLCFSSYLFFNSSFSAWNFFIICFNLFICSFY